MKKVLVLAFSMLLAVSCSTDENEIVSQDTQQSAGNLELLSTQSETNSEEMTGQELADHWAQKYEDFKNYHDLDVDQLALVNTLETFVYDAQLNGSYDETVADDLLFEASLIFEFDPWYDLFYGPTNGSTTGVEWCFWCNEPIEVGPCEIVQEGAGGWSLMRTVTVQRYRFGIPWGQRTHRVGCSIFEFWAEDPNG
jgi:hypothetical protein